VDEGTWGAASRRADSPLFSLQLRMQALLPSNPDAPRGRQARRHIQPDSVHRGPFSHRLSGCLCSLKCQEQWQDLGAPGLARGLGKGATGPGTCVFYRSFKRREVMTREDTHVAVRTKDEENSVNDIILTIPFSMKN